MLKWITALTCVVNQLPLACHTIAASPPAVIKRVNTITITWLYKYIKTIIIYATSSTLATVIALIKAFINKISVCFIVSHNCYLL